MLKHVFLLCLAFVLATSQSTGNNELLQAINTALSKWISSGSAAASWATWYGGSYTTPGTCTGTYPANPTAGGTLAAVISRGQLNIGSDVPSPPLYFTNGSSTIIGFDQDFANFLASELSTQYSKTITVSRVTTSFSNLLSDLVNTTNFDVASGGMLVTPARQALAAFACNISTNGFSGLVTDNVTYPTSQQVLATGVKVGVLIGSQQEALATQAGCVIVSVNDIDEGYALLINGTINAYLSSQSTVQYWLKTNPDSNATALPVFGTVSGVAWATRFDANDNSTTAAAATTAAASATTAAAASTAAAAATTTAAAATAAAAAATSTAAAATTGTSTSAASSAVVALPFLLAAVFLALF